MTQIEPHYVTFERRIKMLHWFIDGIGIHGIDLSLYKALTPDWVTKNYNVEI